ncbi:hypothetical protein ACHAPT_012422 [Fusarium lateritium]
MASPFESLPLELFQAIIQETDLVGIWGLQQCNHPLEIILDPHMLARPHAVHKLMSWGCLNGNIWAVNKALLHGIDISVIGVAWKDNGIILAPTLCLAAATGKYDTFEFLLKSGAQTDAVVHSSQAATFKKRLFDPRFPGFIGLCDQYGLRHKIPDIQSNLDKTLVEAVKSNLGLDLCRSWLDLGANPTARAGKSWNPETALSLAILFGSSALVKLLLSRNCDLNVPAPVSRPHHNDIDIYTYDLWNSMPMFAAARRLAKDGNTDMMEPLLEAGADINVAGQTGQRTLADIFPCMDSFTSSGLAEGEHLTPLWMYILSVDLSAEVSDPRLSPSRIVCWFFDKGVKIQTGPPMHMRYNLELLALWRFYGGAKCLLNDEIFAIVKLFLENGAAKHKVELWLTGQGEPSSRYFGSEPCFNLDQQALGIERWGVIVNLLLRDENFDHKMVDEIDNLLLILLKYIMNCLCSRGNHPVDPCPPELLTRFYDISHPIMIQKLLDLGADINATSRRLRRGRRVLTALNYSYRNYDNDRCSWLPESGRFQIRQLRSFVSMIANLGAASPNLQEQRSFEPDGTYNLWKCAIQGEVAQEERLLWNPTAGALIDRPDRLNPDERGALQRQRKEAEELFYVQAHEQD